MCAVRGVRLRESVQGADTGDFRGRTGASHGQPDQRPDRPMAINFSADLYRCFYDTTIKRTSSR
jgi:hypothetical protein